jgi:hypothetical protein
MKIKEGINIDKIKNRVDVIEFILQINKQ